jgi:hypothetical protein
MRLLRIACLCFWVAAAHGICRGQSLCAVSLLDADPSAHELVKKILEKLVQKPGTILVFTSTDPQVIQRHGAVSSDCPMGNGLQRWIVYDPEVISDPSGRDFALAHETAHHLNRHVLSGDTLTKQQELEADQYAARYLTILGWSKERLLHALDELNLPKQATTDYPSLDERKAAVIAGYEAVAQATTKQSAHGFDSAAAAAIAKPLKPLLLWSTLVHPPQPADWNDCGKPGTDSIDFTTSEESAWLYYSFDSGSTGNEGAVEWISPSGTVYSRQPFTTSAPSTGCYRWFLSIRGFPPSAMPGSWEVRIVYNGLEIGRREFTIKPPGAHSANSNDGTPEGLHSYRPVESDPQRFLANKMQTVVRRTPGQDHVHFWVKFTVPEMPPPLPTQPPKMTDFYVISFEVSRAVPNSPTQFVPNVVPSQYGHWKSGDEVKLEFDLPIALSDSSQGWTVRFCIGEPLRCAPGPNLLLGEPI